MPKRGENIYKRKDGRWEGRYKTGRNCKRSMVLPVSLLNKTSK